MTYYNDIPARDNSVLDPVSGDVPRMRANFLELASIVSGVSRPAAGQPMSALTVTSGSTTFTMGWTAGIPTATFYINATPMLYMVGSQVQPGPGISLRAVKAPTHVNDVMRLADIASPVSMIEALGGHIITLTAGAIFALDERAMYDYDIQELHAKTASGTVVVSAKINGAIVSGLSSLTISGTQSSHVSTGAYSVTSGDRLTLVLGAVSGEPSDLSFTMKTVRA